MIAKVADIVFSVSINRPIELIHIEETYRDFYSTEKPDVTIHAHYNGIPQLNLRDTDGFFDSEVIWRLFHTNGNNIIVMRLPSDSRPYRIAIFDSDFRRGEVYSHDRLTDGGLPNPLEFPLSEVLMVCLLAKYRGLMVHACGIDDRGQGYLFAGNSTHGKTTMARLWKDYANILNDDRIVIRKKGDHFWMYGTPWHGEYTGVSPQGVPIEKIFFLNHAEKNSVKKYNGASVASMLLARSFPPLWDAEGMKFTLDFCAQLVDIVPCYKLNFVPDENIVDFVRCVK